MVHSVNGWKRGVQVKLWDPLRTHAIPERLRGVFTTRRYTNTRLPLPLPYLNPVSRQSACRWLTHKPSSRLPLFYARSKVNCSATQHSDRQLRDHSCGTLCHLRYDRPPATDSLGDIWKHIYLEPRNHSALWRSTFAPYKYSYSLTCVLTTFPESFLHTHHIRNLTFTEMQSAMMEVM